MKGRELPRRSDLENGSVAREDLTVYLRGATKRGRAVEISVRALDQRCRRSRTIGTIRQRAEAVEHAELTGQRQFEYHALVVVSAVLASPIEGTVNSLHESIGVLAIRLAETVQRGQLAVRRNSKNCSGFLCPAATCHAVKTSVAAHDQSRRSPNAVQAIA